MGIEETQSYFCLRTDLDGLGADKTRVAILKESERERLEDGVGAGVSASGTRRAMWG